MTMASSHRNQDPSEIIDEALRLVDAVQRRLLTAAIRRKSRTPPLRRRAA